MHPKKPAFKNMNQCCLTTGFEFEGEAPVYLDIAPTMKNITYGGHLYHRMPGSWGWDEKTGKTHGTYLRDDYGDRKKVQLGILKQSEIDCEPPPGIRK